MKQTIYITSQINKERIPVGSIDILNRDAIFEITPKRLFVEANSFGIDRDVFKRKSIEFCKRFIFNFWDGRKIILTRDEFMSNCWLYPKKADNDYKAPPTTFKPKFVLTIEKAEEIIKNRPKETKEEELKRLFREGILS